MGCDGGCYLIDLTNLDFKQIQQLKKYIGYEKDTIKNHKLF